MQLFEIISNHTWIVIDNLSHYHVHHQNRKQQGSLACRQLLTKLQGVLMIDGIFNEQTLPYQLQNHQQNYQISFSHSQRKIAILLSKSKQLGIDIENRAIHHQIIAHFFSKNEYHWLQDYQSNVSFEQFNMAKTLFWTLKESFLKYQADKDSRLSFWLKKDFIHYLDEMNIHKLLLPSQKFNLLQIHQQKIGFFPSAQCSFVIAN